MIAISDLTVMRYQAANQKEKYHKICLKKQNTPIRDLCKSLPPEFAALLTYCRSNYAPPQLLQDKVMLDWPVAHPRYWSIHARSYHGESVESGWPSFCVAGCSSTGAYRLKPGLRLKPGID